MLAVGPVRYHQMARWLLTSIRRSHPGWPLAVATDRPRQLRGYADEIVPVRVPEHGPYGLKLSLNELSPFGRTLVLDVDSLMVRPMPDVWDFFDDAAVGVLGYNVSDGEWFGKDLAELCREHATATLPRFNGGFFYFDRSDLAQSVFADARGYLARYPELGFQAFRGARADEPMLALALARHGIPARHDGDRAFYRTTRAAEGPIYLDLERGECELRIAGQSVRPSIIHFASSEKDPVYAREAQALMSRERDLGQRVTRALLRRRVGREYGLRK